ncbi:MAG: hypothetical protein PHV42_01545 [Candidatus Pacebacteria bacterium]|nr:hypothetical protein [Candidatus Paceibacterota bacterium]
MGKKDFPALYFVDWMGDENAREAAAKVLGMTSQPIFKVAASGSGYWMYPVNHPNPGEVQSLMCQLHGLQNSHPNIRLWRDDGEGPDFWAPGAEERQKARLLPKS